MSVDIKLKHSAVKDKKPTASDLKLGEVALNINEQSVAAYVKDSAGNVVQLAKGGVDTDYVQTKPEGDASQNVSGNLTLGTDKITLDASDGSAEFSSDVTVYGTSDLVFKTSPTSGVDPTTYSRSGISHNASLGSGDQKTLFTIDTKNTSASVPGPVLAFKSDGTTHSGGQLELDVINGSNTENANYKFRAAGFYGYDKDGGEKFF